MYMRVYLYTVYSLLCTLDVSRSITDELLQLETWCTYMYGVKVHFTTYSLKKIVASIIVFFRDKFTKKNDDFWFFVTYYLFYTKIEFDEILMTNVKVPLGIFGTVFTCKYIKMGPTCTPTRTPTHYLSVCIPLATSNL